MSFISPYDQHFQLYACHPWRKLGRKSGTWGRTHKSSQISPLPLYVSDIDPGMTLKGTIHESGLKVVHEDSLWTVKPNFIQFRSTISFFLFFLFFFFCRQTYLLVFHWVQYTIKYSIAVKKNSHTPNQVLWGIFSVNPLDQFMETPFYDHGRRTDTSSAGSKPELKIG